jgi:putative phosphoribosyl transferase
VRFRDRTDAGRRLARRLEHLRADDVVVLGLPRGGVPVAYEVATALGAPLDVILVRKLGAPFQPELAMGAIGEGGVRVSNDDVIRRGGITDDEVAAVEERERLVIDRQALQFRSGRSRVAVAGRTAIVVDDGIATGATAAAACHVARRQGAGKVVLAAPVGAPESVQALQDVCDEVVCPEMPPFFLAVGTWYDDFRGVSDSEVTALLARAAEQSAHDTAPARDTAAAPAREANAPDQAHARDTAPAPDTAHAPAPPADGTPPATEPPGSTPPSPASGTQPRASAPRPPRAEEVMIDAGGVSLPGHLVIPPGATGHVIFVHGSGSSRHSPRNKYVAAELNNAGFGTLLFDLLTTEEERDRANVFDVGKLASRLAEVTRWLREQPGDLDAAIGYFGASTGAAAALIAASEPGAHIQAVVSRGGRPDLAGARLADVRAPTLLIVGSRDEVVLDLNRDAQRQLRGPNQLAIVPGATHLFEEPGALETVTRLARDWLSLHLAAPAQGEADSRRSAEGRNRPAS